jgi:hypothetical protein
MKWPNRLTQWRPRNAAWQFGSHGGTAIGKLEVRRKRKAHELVWRVRDRAALERRLQLMFARSEHRDWAAARLVEKFIEDVTLYPLEWPTFSEPISNDEWRFGAVTVRFRRYPSDQMIEVLEIHSDQDAAPGAAPNGGPATPVGNSGARGGPPSVS